MIILKKGKYMRKPCHYIAISVLLTTIGCDKQPPSEPTDQQATQAPAAVQDPAGLIGILVDAADGKSASMALSGFFSIELAMGWEIEDVNPVIESITSGTIQTQGRSIPAGIVRARFKFIHRSRGERKQKFILIAGAEDKEFAVWRAVMTEFKEEEANTSVEAWKTRNSFQQQRSQ